MMSAARTDDGTHDVLLMAAAVNNYGKDTVLHSACRVGDVDVVKHIISQNKVSIDSRGEYGRTPVMYAANQGHVVVFKLLVREGADVSIVDGGGDNIIHLACIGGHLDMVKHILSQNIFSVDSIGRYGMTPVMLSAKKEHKNVFNLLVREGADVSIVNDYGNNVLHLACICGNVEMVKAIISQNVVSIDSEGKYGMTPVMKAAEKGHMGVFELLVTEGADVSVVNAYGSNILHLACLGGHVDLVKRIVSQKVVGIECDDIYGRTAVIFAATYGHMDVFKLLVTEGADLSVVDDDRDNILHVACFGGDVDMVKHIISDKIVSIESKGKYGMTPVMFAVAKGHMDVFKLLVTEGADLSVVDNDGNNILHLACVRGNVDMVMDIISDKIVSIESKGKYGMTPVMFAVAKGHMDVFKLLVTEGADVSVVDDNASNILHAACFGGDVDMVKHIISQNIVSKESKGKYGMTPVMFAVAKGHMDVFKLLVTEGADVSVVDDNASNILHAACFGGDVDMVKHIISQNIVSINSKGQHGRTPVMYAAGKGHMDVFKLLVREGADLSIVDTNASNILHVACTGGYVDIVKHVISQNIVSIDSKGKYGMTPVMYAVTNGHRGVFMLLLTEGANASVVVADGDNILHLACVDGNVDMVKLILSQNILSIDSKGQYARTPVMYAAGRGYRNLFKLLMSLGADLSVVDDNGENFLHHACDGGNVDIVKLIIPQHIVSIDSKGKYGRTPMMYAVLKGQVAIFKLLVREGADLSVVDDNASNILHLACLGGDVDIMKHIISQNIVGIDSKGNHGMTSVMYAVAKGHTGMFELLVTEGADLSIVVDGVNILHLACAGGNANMVKHVISQNIVSIDSKGQCGRTPLMCAAKSGHMAMFKLLVREGADLSIVDEKASNILHLACIGGKLDIVKHIISQNIVGIDSKGEHGMTPAMCAVANGHTEVFELLLTEGADLSIVADDGDNILHLACELGHVDMVKLIISQNIVSIDSKGQYARTPVMYAAGRGYKSLVKLLMSLGADLSVVDDNGKNILHISCVGGHVDIVKLIISQNIVSIDSKGEYGRTPMMYAALEEQMTIFKLLVTEGADLSIVDDNVSNILHLACALGNVDMVKHIISQNIVGIDSKGKYGMTPVMLAVVKGHTIVFELLLTEGADVSVVLDNGDNILHLACALGNMDMVKHIISQNIVSIDSKGQCGRTPMMYAAKKGRVDIIKFLVLEGADVSAVDAHGDNMVDIVQLVMSWNCC